MSRGDCKDDLWKLERNLKVDQEIIDSGMAAKLPGNGNFQTQAEQYNKDCPFSSGAFGCRTIELLGDPSATPPLFFKQLSCLK